MTRVLAGMHAEHILALQTLMTKRCDVDTQAAIALGSQSRKEARLVTTKWSGAGMLPWKYIRPVGPLGARRRRCGAQ